MHDSCEDRVRHRAREIWEREGRPEGRHEIHWAQACAEIEAAERTADAEVETVALVAEPEAPRRRRARAGDPVTATKRASRAKPATHVAEAGPGEEASVDAVPAAEKPKATRVRALKGKPVREASMTVVTSKKRSKAVWSPADIKPEKAASSTKTHKAAKQIAGENGGDPRQATKGRAKTQRTPTV
ncbi:hypothetical protein M2351_004250 [Azospirillum canadense]|nr:hypothetical protein [Azospirillum canadense]